MRKIPYFIIFIITIFAFKSLAGSQLAVKIPSNMKVCTSNDECVMVVLCSACCGGDALNKEYQEEFSSMYSKTCDGYSGGVCDCAYSGNPTPICENGECKIKITPFKKD